MLFIQDNALRDSNHKTIATFSTELRNEDMSSYAHLFATAAELLDLLERKVSFALEILGKQMNLKPTLTGYRPYANRYYPDVPGWIDDAVQTIALAYGEPSNINEEDLGLSISATEVNALESSNGDIVLRLSEKLSKDEVFNYIHLFLAAPALLRIIEVMAKGELAEIDREYKSNKEFDPLGADESRFIIPDRIRNINDLVAKAKGATPIKPKK